MGSHGGGTSEGQARILAHYGVTEQTMGVPIETGMDVECLGVTEDGVDVLFSAVALQADGIVLVNRVKPHTDFGGALGSGLLKMIAIGLGKRAGASACHAAASRLGYERVIRSVARIGLHQAPILGGVAIIENQRHETARLAVLGPDNIESGEAELLEEARRLMPRLPFDEVDLLIVDRLGKNISGTGLDPNVIGRGVQGYSSALKQGDQKPMVRRIFVRDLTRETRGNAVGIGLADFTTTRLVRAMDLPASYLNSLTALTLQLVKIPMHFDTDREVICRALSSLAMADTRQAKVMRISDTLSLEHLEVSDAYAELLAPRHDLAITGDWQPMAFDSEGNLLPLRV
jgi:hypothetical protein